MFHATRLSFNRTFMELKQRNPAARQRGFEKF